MKTNSILLVCIGALLIGFSACKTQKTVQKITDATEVLEPFSGKEYLTDSEYFRASASGTSPNREDAKTTAYTNAYATLGLNIKVLLTRAIDNFTQRLDAGVKQDFEGSLSNHTWIFIDETIKGSRTIGSKLFLEKDKSYTSYVAIEVSTKSILDGMNTEISKNKKMEISYDRKKFAEDVEKEKERMAKEKASNEK